MATEVPQWVAAIRGRGDHKDSVAVYGVRARQDGQVLDNNNKKKVSLSAEMPGGTHFLAASRGPVRGTESGIRNSGVVDS